MESNGTDAIHKGNIAEGSGTTIEIKIKTLDSQTYTLRVNKQMTVPELKEQIASVTGVLSEQQRVICRGRVLKDDQLLSAYHVEDGHTLHLVTRQPVPTSSGTLPSDPVIEPPSSSPGRRIQVAPGIVVEAFDVTGQGDGVHPDINRIVSAVLGAFGINDTGGAIAGVDVQAGDSGVHERTTDAIGITASTSPQNEQAGLMGHSGRSNSGLGVPAAISLGALHPRVIPDSLTTLSQYLSHMRQEYGTNGESNAQGTTMQDTQSQSTAVFPVQERLPTSDALADIFLSTREMLVDQTAECLLQLGGQLHEQSDVTDATRRLSVQSNAWRSGVLFQNLGAFLLELGRTTMMLRMGQMPSEAMVNAGPAVFISQAGPNPLMVQPLPFQPGASFGVIPRQTGSGMLNDTSVGLFPRRIDIQIRRGSSGVERDSLPPIRAMVAAVPGPISRLPELGRLQHVTSGHLTDRRGLQASSEHHPTALQASSEHHPTALQELQQVSDSGVQQNTGEHLRDGNLTNAAVEQAGQLPSPNSSPFRLSVLSTSETENHHASEREVPSEVYQILGALFPGSDIQVEEAGPRTTTASATDSAGATSTAMNGQETEPIASDEGIFLSNLLRQVMPRISQQSDGALDDISIEASHGSEYRTAHESSTEAGNSDVGTSRRQSDVQSGKPNSKRQKME